MEKFNHHLELLALNLEHIGNTEKETRKDLASAVRTLNALSERTSAHTARIDFLTKLGFFHLGALFAVVAAYAGMNL